MRREELKAKFPETVIYSSVVRYSLHVEPSANVLTGFLLVFADRFEIFHHHINK